MRKRLGWGVALAFLMASCATPQGAPVPTTQPPNAPFSALGIPADGEVYPTSNHYRVLATEELPLVGVTADSQSAGYPASNLIDGNLSTEWANGGYKDATAWAAVQLSASASLGAIGIKTGPSAAGTSYDVQVSNDGNTWNTVLSNQTNTTWNMETKTLPAGTTGSYVRIFWHNSPSSPQPHFSIFELEVNGTPGTGPSPTPSVMPSPTPTPSTVPSPTPSPVNTPTPMPSTTSTPGGTITQLMASGVTADSTYNGLSPQNAIDGNLSTQWANGGYKNAEAWLALQFEQSYEFDHLAIKTGALPAGVTYQVEVSNDGTTWTAASGRLTNSTWNLETKAVSGSGRFLRLHFFNSASNPLARFSVFEVRVFGSGAATNTAPVISGFTQSPMKISASGTLSVQASDPDGDALTYTWTAASGTVTGSGPQVTYQVPSPINPGHPDDTVTVTVSDGHGNQTSKSFTVDNYIGSYTDEQANDPNFVLQWAPTKTAYVSLAGNVTATASGSFSVYSAVICEYRTTQGRQMALLKPGVATLLPGCQGDVFMYLLGPTGSAAPTPNIAVNLTNGSQTRTASVTQANVVGGEHFGYQMMTLFDDFVAGETTAKNGQYPYTQLLEVACFGPINDTEYGSQNNTGSILYVLHKTGDLMYGLDPRLAYGDYDDRLLLTDSQGALGDNTGFWRIYDITEGFD